MEKKIVEPIQYESMIPKIVNEVKSKDLTVTELDFKNMVELSKHASSKEDLVTNIREIFPDIELARELLTSLIISPNDLGDGKLNYSLDALPLPTSMKSMLTGLIGNYVETNYKIEDKLSTIVDESLITKGSYIELNVPPKNIADLLEATKASAVSGEITAGVESIIANVSGRRAIRNDGVVNITSNTDVLFTEMLANVQLSVANESLYSDDLTPGLENLIVTEGGYGIMNDDELSDDKPIIKKLPSSSVIPVADKADPSKHYGAFVILNNKKANGDTRKPITETSGSDLIKRVNKSLGNMTSTAPELNDIGDLRNTLIKAKLQKFLDNNGYKNISNIEFEITDELLLELTDSLLDESPIDVLFVPNNLISYYAINFRRNGMGESLLEKLTVLMSMRAMLLYIKMLSYVKSSVTTTNVKVDLDPDDPEYRKSMHAIMTEVIKNRQVSMPIGILNTDDLADWVHKLGFSFDFKHPGLPEVNIDVEEKSTKIEPIDSSLKEDIDKLIITSLYLTPEMIDNSYSPDFATTIIANNLLLKKRISKLQKQYNKLISSDISKKLKLDGRFKNFIAGYIKPNISQMRKFLKKSSPDINKDAIDKATDEELTSYIIHKLINGLTVSLPTPETTEDTNTSEMVSNYTELLDDVIDRLFSSDLIPSEYIGELGDNLDSVKDLLKHTLLKRYIDSNNILPDFTNMFILDEDGKPMHDLLGDFTAFGDTLGNVILPFLKDNKKMVEKLDKKLDKITGDDDGYSDDNVDDDDTGDTGLDDDTGEDDDLDTPPTDDEGEGDVVDDAEEPIEDEEPVEDEEPIEGEEPIEEEDEGGTEDK